MHAQHSQSTLLSSGSGAAGCGASGHTSPYPLPSRRISSASYMYYMHVHMLQVCYKHSRERVGGGGGWVVGLFFSGDTRELGGVVVLRGCLQTGQARGAEDQPLRIEHFDNEPQQQ